MSMSSLYIEKASLLIDVYPRDIGKSVVATQKIEDRNSHGNKDRESLRKRSSAQM